MNGLSKFLHSAAGRSCFCIVTAALLGAAMVLSLRFGALKLTAAEILRLLWERP